MPIQKIMPVQSPFILLIVAFLLVMAVPHAACPGQKALPAGEFITDKGWGKLTISNGNGTTAGFTILAGENGRVCDLEGEIENGRAELPTYRHDKPCIITFTRNGDQIDVATDTYDECEENCGAGAGFAGRYIKPPKGCDSQSIRKTRALFKRLYDKKSYGEARSVLQPIITNCARTLDWFEEGWIRNDLAVTEYKLGNKAACRQILKSLAEDAAKTEEALQEEKPQTVLDSYIPILKATRANLKSCGAGPK